MCAPKVFVLLTLGLSLLVSILSFVALGALPWSSLKPGGGSTVSYGLFIVNTETSDNDDDK